jgi:porin
MRTPALLGALLSSCTGILLAAEQESGWFKCARHVQKGELASAHETLKEMGVEFAFSFAGVWQANHEGGIRSHPRGRTSASWDAALRLDAEKLGLWQGGSFFAHLEGSKGRGIDEPFVGSLFGVNADADTTAGRRLQFSEYWYEQSFADGVVALRFGKMDATTDFDTNAFANDECHQFLNGALVNNPTIPFPDYGLGAQAIVRPGGGFYFAAGGWDANAKGWASGRDTLLGGRAEFFLAAEAGLEAALPGAKGARLPGTYRLGVWRDTRRYEALGGGDAERGESGWYLSFEQMVHKEAVDAEDGQGLGLFFRYGRAAERLSPVRHFWGLGAQYQGLLPGRDDDVLGIGLAAGCLGSPARREVPHRGEAVCECYYAIALRKGVALTLDLQYVRHPGAASPSSLVPGIRLHMEF